MQPVGKAIAGAIVKAQMAFGPALKTSQNPHFKSRYADLSACVEAVIEALNANGIALNPAHLAMRERRHGRNRLPAHQRRDDEQRTPARSGEQERSAGLRLRAHLRATILAQWQLAASHRKTMTAMRQEARDLRKTKQAHPAHDRRGGNTI
jgi:hypothetical protein